MRVFCEKIREADKLDIMELGACESWEEKNDILEGQKISPKVLEDFRNEQIIDRRHVESDIDKILVDLAFIFDYNFKENYKIIKANDYINKTIDRFNFKDEQTKEQMETIRKIANDYIDNQIENN